VNLGRLPEHAISLRQGATHMLIQINEGRFGSFATGLASGKVRAWSAMRRKRK